MGIEAAEVFAGGEMAIEVPAGSATARWAQ